MTDRQRMMLFVPVLLGLGLVSLWAYSAGVLTLGTVKLHAFSLREIAQEGPFLSAIVFVTVFVALTLMLPAAALLTLLGGFLFGPLLAILYVLGATTAAAVLCFLVSRHLAEQWVQKRYADRLGSLNAQIEKHGPVYLIAVRLVPLVPFVAVNLAAGLTRVRLGTFAWTTALGAFPGIAVFSYAGSRLWQLRSVKDAWNANSIAVVVLVSLLLAVGVATAYLLKERRA